MNEDTLSVNPGVSLESKSIIKTGLQTALCRSIIHGSLIGFHRFQASLGYGGSVGGSVSNQACMNWRVHMWWFCDHRRAAPSGGQKCACIRKHRRSWIPLAFLICCCIYRWVIHTPTKSLRPSRLVQLYMLHMMYPIVLSVLTNTSCSHTEHQEHSLFFSLNQCFRVAHWFTL